MKKIERTALALALVAASTWAQAQMPAPVLNTPQPAASSKKLEDLLMCKPSNRFTRKSAERAFAQAGLIRTKDEAHVPPRGQRVTVFGASVQKAYISDQSDQDELTVYFNDRSADELAQQLGIKKRRVNGPSGPEMAYQKPTSKRSHIEIRPQSPSGAAIECVVFLGEL